MSLMNRRVLMTGADYFTVDAAINPYMIDSGVSQQKAIAEHKLIRSCYEQVGITVERVAPPADCQDGIYAANWGLVRGQTVVLSSLPGPRQAEEAYAKGCLEKLGFKTIVAPYRFSGQGDALPCGDRLFMGSQYRTDQRMHKFIADNLGFEVIGLQTVPLHDSAGHPAINKVSGWPDSFFYDLDLALAVLTPSLIAWCPEAFLPSSQKKLQAIKIDKIEVSLAEATQGFACNLISTGKTVVMSARAPQLKAAIEARGFKTITPSVTEIAKGGGYIRCVSLTL